MQYFFSGKNQFIFGFCILILMLMISAMVAGCGGGSAIGSVGGGNGTILVTVPDPPVSHGHRYWNLGYHTRTEYLAYDITVTGPNGGVARVTKLDPATLTDVKLEALAPGEWNITVEGKCGDWVNCRGTATVTLGANETKSVTVPVTIIAEDH